MPPPRGTFLRTGTHEYVPTLCYCVCLQYCILFQYIGASSGKWQDMISAQSWFWGEIPATNRQCARQNIVASKQCGW